MDEELKGRFARRFGPFHAFIRDGGRLNVEGGKAAYWYEVN
jgi:hypothetical protein